jgi:hypothetical protein
LLAAAPRVNPVIDRRSMAAQIAAKNEADRNLQPIATRLKNTYSNAKRYVVPAMSSTAYAERQRERQLDVACQNFILMRRILNAKSSLPTYQ